MSLSENTIAAGDGGAGGDNTALQANGGEGGYSYAVFDLDLGDGFVPALLGNQLDFGVGGVGGGPNGAAGLAGARNF